VTGAATTGVWVVSMVVGGGVLLELVVEVEELKDGNSKSKLELVEVLWDPFGEFAIGVPRVT
jgi:hypothetical protein